MTMDYEKIADEILAVDNAVHYVSIADREGNLVFSKMKEGKKQIIDEREEKVLASDLSVMKVMQGLYNDSLGRVTCMLTTRERIHQIVYFVDIFTIYVSCERNIDGQKIVEIKQEIESTIRKLVQ